MPGGVRSWSIIFPSGMKLLTANEMRKQGHWTKFYSVIRTWRSTACLLAKEAHIPQQQFVKIRAVYYAPDNRRRDTSNIFPTVKAVIDGIVDAGVLPDDSDKYVKSVEMARGDHNIKQGQLVLVIEATHGNSARKSN